MIGRFLFLWRLIAATVLLPHIASFRSGNFDFALVGIHTKPDNAESEIAELESVVESVIAKYPGERDIIVPGDFNADGGYFDEGALNTFGDNYHWAITK